MSIVKSVALFFCAGSSDKEYNILLQEQGSGYVVNYANGRRGNANATGTKTSSPVTLSDAEKIYAKLLKEKMAKGYVPDGDGKPFSGIANANESTGLVPMLLNPITEKEIATYINDSNWMMQEKLDGKRIMIRKADGSVVASNRKGLTCGIPKDIEVELSKIKPDVVFDGELVGNTYHVFDILEINGGKTNNESALKRFNLVQEIIDDGRFKNVVVVECAITAMEKLNMFNSMKHKEGVVVKDKHSPYIAGRPASGGKQLKCKFWASCSAQVLNINAKRSIQVGVVSHGEPLVYVGNVTVPPNYNLPSVGDIVEVKYLYYYVGGSLYQPQYLGIRDDVDADTLSTLKPKATDTDED